MLLKMAYYGMFKWRYGLFLQEFRLGIADQIFCKWPIEFNMRFFDDQFPDINYRMRVLKMFPDEFLKGYVLYKQGN